MEGLKNLSAEELMSRLLEARKKQLKLRQEMTQIISGDVFDNTGINALSERLKYYGELVENIFEEVSNRSAGDVRKCMSLCKQGLGNLRVEQEKVAASRLSGEENPTKTSDIKANINALKWMQSELNDILKDKFASKESE